MALAADMIVCAEHARFSLPEVGLGIIADSGAVLRLPKRIPSAISNELLMTGRVMDAREAQQWGLVNRVVSSDQLMTCARELAQQIVKNAPLSIAAVKEIVRQTSELSVEDGYKLMRSGVLQHYPKVLHSEDALEGPLAFTEGREPQWTAK